MFTAFPGAVPARTNGLSFCICFTHGAVTTAGSVGGSTGGGGGSSGGGGGGRTTAVHASTSAMPGGVPSGDMPVMNTRILSVVMGGNVKRRQTRLLPVTLPPGTSAHAVPFQCCTWNVVKP
jgi:hypothetical protein